MIPTTNDAVFTRATGSFRDLQGARIFLSGGTGFWGRWLLEACRWAHGQGRWQGDVVVLSRAPERFLGQHPALAGAPWLRLVRGAVEDTAWVDDPTVAGGFSHVFHLAAAATDPRGVVEILERGTRNQLAFARDRGAGRFLYASSGAVYGRTPPELERIPESYAAPDASLLTPLGQGKLRSERLVQAAGANGFATVIARGFTFLGPHLPLDAPFAVTSFVRAAREGGRIVIAGDGTPRRSFLYAADLAVWLLRLLTDADPGSIYNVGAGEDLSIRELAERVGGCFTPRPEIVVQGQPEPATRASSYVPDVARAEAELGLEAWTSLADGLRLYLESLPSA